MFDFGACSCEDIENSSYAIEKIKLRLDQAREATKDAQYIENLVLLDYVRTLKTSKTTWDYRIALIEKAQKEIDKKYKKERTNLSYIEQAVKDEFFFDFDFKLKIKEILCGGYEGYYWQLYFEFKGETYVLQIPSRDKLTVKNLTWAQEGKFVLFKQSAAHCITALFSDWTVNGLAKKIKERFKEEKEATE